ncbi:hypothetical protein J6590_038779 [Homalodisca vitripennis]|nr:hypothetical protein J6590_038779 [Homalodisca vitripennis]
MDDSQFPTVFPGFSSVIPGFPRYSVIGDSKNGVFNLRVVNASLEDDAEFQCQVGPSAFHKAIRADARLSVICKSCSNNSGEYGSNLERSPFRSQFVQFIARTVSIPKSRPQDRFMCLVQNKLAQQTVRDGRVVFNSFLPLLAPILSFCENNMFQMRLHSSQCSGRLRCQATTNVAALCMGDY